MPVAAARPEGGAALDANRTPGALRPARGLAWAAALSAPFWIGLAALLL